MAEKYDAVYRPAIERFSKVPWCAPLIDRPGISHYIPHVAAPDTNAIQMSRDQLFHKTLTTANAAPFQLGFFQDPFGEAPDKFTAESSTGLTLMNPRTTILFDLQPGLNGFNGTVHGGLISCLIDETMGCLVFTNFDAVRKAAALGTLPPNVPNMSSGRIFTASMSVQMRKPIHTPTVVAVVAEFTRVEERKLYLKITVKNDKTVFAEGEGLWIILVDKKSKI